jgi:hypothetical protein
VNGQTKDCLRIRAPGAQEKAAKKAKPADGAKPEFDDEIPFAK